MGFAAESCDRQAARLKLQGSSCKAQAARLPRVSSLEDFQDFSRLGEAAELDFREDQLAVFVDFKDTARFFDQFGIDTQC